MKAGSTITTERLLIRHWRDEDRPFFHRINSDPRVMEFYPVRRTRAQSDEMLDRLRPIIEETGMGWAAVTLKETREPIGFAGLATVRFDAAFAPAVEIGWRLAPEHWGKGYATEAAEALLAHGFQELDLARIVSFAVWNNHRSTAVMQRIGMTVEPALDFDHPGVPDTHPHLRRHVFYQITRSEWESRKVPARRIGLR